MRIYLVRQSMTTEYIRFIFLSGWRPFHPWYHCVFCIYFGFALNFKKVLSFYKKNERNYILVYHTG